MPVICELMIQGAMVTVFHIPVPVIAACYISEEYSFFKSWIDKQLKTYDHISGGLSLNSLRFIQCL